LYSSRFHVLSAITVRIEKQISVDTPSCLQCISDIICVNIFGNGRCIRYDQRQRIALCSMECMILCI
jgi:hypothetical protein